MKPIIDYYIRLYIIMFRILCRKYHSRVIQHYEQPRNVGSFKKNEKNIGTGLVGAPACGDVMKLQVKVEDGVIVDAKFKTFGCGSAIASSSVATEWIKGKTRCCGGGIGAWFSGSKTSTNPGKCPDKTGGIV